MEFVHGFLEVWSMVLGIVPSGRGVGGFFGIISILAVWLILVRVAFFVVGKVFRMTTRDPATTIPATRRSTK